MEDIKLVKRITEWNNIGVRTKGWRKESWRDEVINDLEKLKLRNWSQVVKDRSLEWCDAQDHPCKVVVEEGEEKKESLGLNYALSYLFNTHKLSIIYEYFYIMVNVTNNE